LIGANGILNRVAEDGVLLDWFRKPQRKYGTTYRIVSLIALLQAATIVGSRGNLYLLSEAYAFGVVWSFFMKTLGVLALRFQRADQEYKTPGNIRINGREIPVGLILITFSLFLVAIANLFTKKIATIYGVTFSLIFLILFAQYPLGGNLPGNTDSWLVGIVIPNTLRATMARNPAVEISLNRITVFAESFPIRKIPCVSIVKVSFS